MKIIQGDVILRKIEFIPENALIVKGNILQQSETTGHHHYFLKDSEVKIFETGLGLSNTITTDTGKFIVVGEDTVMYHGIPSKKGTPLPNSFDHMPLSVPAGIYKVTIAREWDYDKEEITYVVD